MGAQNKPPAFRNITQVLHEQNTVLAEILHHEGIVNDLMIHIKRGSILGQCLLNDLDRGCDSGTKALFSCEINFHDEIRC